MYNSNFRRCGFGCFGTGRCRPQSNYPMKNRVESRPGRDVNGSVCSGNGHENSKRLLLKSSSFGGLVLPEGMAGEATYHVASLNLDTSGCKDFLVLLNFSCNITANVLSLIHIYQIIDLFKYLIDCLPHVLIPLFCIDCSTLKTAKK